MKNIFKCSFYFAAIFIIALSSIYAQDTTAAADDNVAVEVLSFDELMALTSSVASKSEEGIFDSPSSVTVFTHKEIESMGVTTLSELLNFVPGFQTTRDIEQGDADRASSRGRSTPISESILFLLNGQRLNDLYTGGAVVINKLIPVENIKQVEIIRGPGSALYGSNAFLGVVNIVTADDFNSAHFTLGSNNRKEADVNFSKTAGDVTMSGFLKGFSSDGYKYNKISDMFGVTGSTTDPSKGVDAYLTMNYKTLTVHARHMDRTLNNFLTFGTLDNNVNNESSAQSSIDAVYTSKFNDNFSLEFRTGYSYDEWQAQALMIPAGTEIAPDFILANSFIGGPFLSSYDLNFNIDGFAKLSGNNELTAGATFVNSAVTDAKNLMTNNPVTLQFYDKIMTWDDDSTAFGRKATRNIFGLYVQDKQKIGDFLSLIAGLRYDRYNDFGSSLNPRFAVIYSTPFNSVVKFMYGNAFRAPNFLELYDKNNPVDFGNAHLKAEKIQTIEVAYTQKISNLAATATFFTNNMSDQIILGPPVQDAFNPLGAPSFVNGGALKTKGLEFELKYSPLENIIIVGTYTKLLDADALEMPPAFGSLIVNLNLGKLNLNLNGIYREKMLLLPTQDSYSVVNGAVSYNLVDFIKVQLRVSNLFDTNYRTITSVFTEGVPNPGRTASLGVMVNF